MLADFHSFIYTADTTGTTPSKCARLPAITLNCSLANLRGTANWTGSEFEVVHVEAICHQGEATEDKVSLLNALLCRIVL